MTHLLVQLYKVFFMFMKFESFLALFGLQKHFLVGDSE